MVLANCNCNCKICQNNLFKIATENNDAYKLPGHKPDFMHAVSQPPKKASWANMPTRVNNKKQKPETASHVITTPPIEKPILGNVLSR